MNYDKIAVNSSEALVECIKNAENFLISADFLIKRARYREALLLTMYAAEEIGKIILVFNYQFYTESEEKLLSWKKRFFDHTEKFWFLRNLDEIEHGYIPSKVQKGEGRKLKNNRMEISYVDFRGGGFVFPRRVTRNEALNFFKQINKKYQRMKKIHPNKDAIKEQIKMLKNIPRDYNEMVTMLKKRGLQEKE